MTWRSAAAAVALALLLPHAAALCQSLTVLPAGRFMPRRTADALSHQLSLSRVTDNREWIGAIGLELPLLQWGDRVQAGAGASVFNRILKTPGHITVVTVDYRVDFPVDLRLDSLRVRLAFGHISSHYADDGIELLGRRSISSVRDYLHAGAGWTFGRGLLYAGVTHHYHNEPVSGKPWELQAGGEVSVVRFSESGAVYAAADVKLKQDVGWGTTRSLQAGVRLFEGERGSVRLAFTRREGFEERGQLYNERRTAHLLSVSLDVP